MASVEDLLSFGKRHLVCGDVPQAVEYFQKACETIAKEHGDLDPKLGEPNLLYGTALIELSRMENMVIGNALGGESTRKILEDAPDANEADNNFVEEVPEMTEEQKEELSRQVIDAMCEEKDISKEAVDDTDHESIEKMDTELGTSVKTGVESKSDDKSNYESESNEKSTAESSEKKSDDEDASDQDSESSEDNEENDGEKSGTDEDEVTNLQLAWEVIEVAKQIFGKSDDKESRLKVAECLSRLAEISREKEDYVHAISDLQECLRIQTDILGSFGREIAETYFQMGSTHAIAGDHDKACESFRESVRSLQGHVDAMKEKIEKMKEDNAPEETIKQAQMAMKDVSDLIPDVERRCADAQEDRAGSSMNPIIMEQLAGSTSSKLTNGSAHQPADDISHLVRKKRTVDQGALQSSGGTETDTPQNDEVGIEAKKPRILVNDVVNEAEHVNGGPKNDN